MSDSDSSGYVLITGGAGFIGTNLADRLLSRAEKVVILDDFSRTGAADNARWLRETHGARVHIERGDCRDADTVKDCVEGASSVFHLAAQVAVTTSLAHPLLDFESNARGTLNVLEAIRRLPRRAPLLYTSTNKVYGPLDDVKLEDGPTSVVPLQPELRKNGIDESRPLDFHSPYGCSKGAADQYVLDYARTFDMPAAVFRMSCIYGPHQHGNEDQGWVAHFLIRALSDESITLYGDGKQVRDILYVDDLVDAMIACRSEIHGLTGLPFNMGGGTRNTTSLLDLLSVVRELTGRRTMVRHEPCRLADQRYYASNHARFSSKTGWNPRVGVREGVESLARWLEKNRGGVSAEESNLSHPSVEQGALP